MARLWSKGDSVGDILQKILEWMPEIWAKIGGSGGGGGVVQQGAKDGTAQPWEVDASSTTALPLPAGAATSVLQNTGNASAASIDSKLGTLGQQTMAGSTPVAIASDQTTLPVSVASLPLPAGGATSANQLPASSLTTASNVTVGTAGTAVNFGSNPATRECIFNAPVSNQGMIYLGDMSVTNGSGVKSGIMLTPAGSVRLLIDNTDLVWANADNNGDQVYATAI